MVTISSSSSSSSSKKLKKSNKKPQLLRVVYPLWKQFGLASLVIYLCLVIYFFRELSSTTTTNNNNNNHDVHNSIQRLITKDEHHHQPQQQQQQSHQKKPSPQQSSTDDDDDDQYQFDRSTAEAYLQQHGPSNIRKTIGAYLEPPINYYVPGTINQGDPAKAKDNTEVGIPPQFITPQPLRTFTPDDLQHYQYPAFQSCHDGLPSKLPVDRGLQFDGKNIPLVTNVGNDPTSPTYPQEEAPYCPVEADPFLPWIHDIFPSHDGSVIEFIAHNRRRCRTGRVHLPDILRLEPQVSLLQHVSVQRLSEKEAVQLAPELWKNSTSGSSTSTEDIRYRLAPMEESDVDGQFTRFICRFYGTQFSSSDQQKQQPQSVLIQEVLSVYPYNYEYVSYRKGKPTMLSPKGKDNQYFWTSVLRFQCPVPKRLQHLVRSGRSVLSDGTPTLHVDVVPIRTPPRFGVDQHYLSEDQIGPRNTWSASNYHKKWNQTSTPQGFDPVLHWGSAQVLPRVEASGRWTNLPICGPPQLSTTMTMKKEYDDSDQKKTTKTSTGNKPHYLSACVWAASSFKTRGRDEKAAPVTDTAKRLVEWLEFHFMVGFDHVYLFDNSRANNNDTTLEPILRPYIEKAQVTRIDWPSIVCNNNIPAHDSTGERSSQYTAENACRTRYAPFTEWMASMDTDEYMIPMGHHTSLKTVLEEASSSRTNILTFRSSRARLLYEKSKEIGGLRQMLDNYTYLEAYNCDSSSSPKPEWAERARKQIYRADYVPYHYVHYSTVTQGLMQTYGESSSSARNTNYNWKRYWNNDVTERVANELTEATMLHTKSTLPEQTSRWKQRCHYQFEKKWRGCSVGFAWPTGLQDENDNHRPEDGMEYNCFRNDKVDSYWLPQLKQRLDEL
eukprot:CAMPEP_0194240100 /NCGR_PEP_ID=MMETSP0158-20130606/6376_1 /TAXON_ID=33649 /ORGANISM="Thalassionema nitzschioides, Strain L26-B" /LENGTH=889 /DNA_ID=CAMNT_0038974739 /DNA_START=67 /DNA_END=2736 /DNA_ORIENTATION=+